MHKIINSIVVVSCTVFTASIAIACEPMHEGLFGEKIFAAMDSNKDGVISKKEFDAFNNKHFKEMDSNHDGKITPEEFQPAHSLMKKDHCDEAEHSHNEQHGDVFINRRFDAADANHDGALSREEAKSTPMILQHFDEIDANKDGKVTEEELKAWMEGHDPEHGNSEKAPEKK
jgi:Ca2+-binding EF-hand superfamily protein